MNIHVPVANPPVKAGLIYADPAWTFDTYSDAGKDRSPENHYACMSINDIKRLPVLDIAADNCVLLMWAIDPLLDRAFEVIDALGFKYKTVGFYYVKTGRGMCLHKGMGYWTRANPEICLLATRGRPKRLAKDISRVVMAPRGRHSEKPHLYGQIERLVAGPYVELFARYAHPGWWQWGNEVGKLGGVPNLIHLPGFPARAVPNEHILFAGAQQ